MAQPLGDTAADEDLVSAAVDDAIQLAMVVTLSGGEAAFAELERRAARRLRMAGRDAAAAGDALGLIGAMPAFIEAPAALQRLRGIGLRLGVLTQSTEEAAEGVLRFAGLRDRLELWSARPESGAFKPDPRPYRLASSGWRRRRTRSRSWRRTGGTWPAPRPPACARAGSPAATSCSRTACRSPTSAGATCSRSPRAWPRWPRRGRSAGSAGVRAGGGSCAG